MKSIQKFAAGFASATLVVSAFVPSVFASTDIEISDNGTDSNNSVAVVVTNESSTVQQSDTEVEVGISSKANTGGNSASGNTGGDSSVDTGNAKSDVVVEVVGGSNQADDDCGCPESDTDVTIEGNGKDSTNEAAVVLTSLQERVQQTRTRLRAEILSKAKTGKNRANKNTNGGASVDTGSSSSFVNVFLSGGFNLF